MSPAIVLIPIYQAVPSALETFSLDHSLSQLKQRDILFIGPEGLDTAFYRERYPHVAHLAFPARYFASVHGYSQLLVSQDFYARFLTYEFMLILQTDAILLRDELDWWCARPFDYVGAPWPEGFEIFVNGGLFEGDKGKRVRTHVGNGGFSLRRVRKCLALLKEFGPIVSFFEQSGSNEDLFFAIMGNLSQDFVLPNEIMASRFAVELNPSYYYQVNGGHRPMGGHAWWKYEPEYWRALLPDAPLPSQTPVI